MHQPASATPLWQPETGGGAVAPGERQLLAAIERLVRAPQGWSVVALHLSRMLPPAPRPYHRRVARAMMQDAAQRADGQVFTLRNADIVLLSRDSAPPATALAERLRQVFGREAADPASIVSDWKLPLAGAVLLAYTVERLGDPETPVVEEAAPPPAGVLDAVAEAIAGARPQDLVQRQIAVGLDPAASDAGVTMRTAYRELTFSLETLEARLTTSVRLSQDTALLPHLGRYLDQRMLQILQLDRGSLSPLDVGSHGAMPLHLNLTLPGVLSDAFAALAAQCQADGQALGVEIALVEAVADLERFQRARDRLHQAGARLVLDGASHLALLLAHPAALGADLLKLDWAPRMAELGATERADLMRAVAEADPTRIILHRADSEAAIRWGLAHRIRLFQGRHIDQMLAVQRMLGCPGAGACTLRQCVDRAAATGGAGRAACTNLKLLDAGLPAAGAKQ